MNLELYESAQKSPVWRDMSHFGQFHVVGQDAARLLHHLTTNDINRLQVGHSIEAVLISAKARVLDLVTVIRLETQRFLVITSPNRRDMFPGHARQFILFRQDVKIEDVTGKTPLTGLFSVGGETVPAELRTAAFASRRLPGDGWISLAPPPAIPSLADNDVYNVLRVEAGVPVTGLELTEEVNPWEAGLEETISLHKGCYNGQEVVARLNTYNKVKQQLCGLRFSESVVATRQSLMLEEKKVGLLTSAVRSPRYGFIGLGFVRNAAAESGQPLRVAGSAGATAEIQGLPFTQAPHLAAAGAHE